MFRNGSLTIERRKEQERLLEERSFESMRIRFLAKMLIYVFLYTN